MSSRYLQLFSTTCRQTKPCEIFTLNIWFGSTEPRPCILRDPSPLWATWFSSLSREPFPKVYTKTLLFSQITAHFMHEFPMSGWCPRPQCTWAYSNKEIGPTLLHFTSQQSQELSISLRTTYTVDVTGETLVCLTRISPPFCISLLYARKIPVLPNFQDLLYGGKILHFCSENYCLAPEFHQLRSQCM